MMLEIGYNHPVERRQYSYPFDPLAGRRIVYISDLHYHLGSRKRVDRDIEQLQQLKPDLLLLGGDFVDTFLGLKSFRHLLQSLQNIPCYVIAGNHDRLYIRTIQKIAEEAGASWLHNTTTTVQLGDQQIRIDGTRAQPAATDTQTLSILCLHQPIDIRPLTSQYHLVFAGHLHGGQFVFWETPEGLYPGRYIYQWNQRSIDYGHCRYLISKGLGDTVPIRYRCSRDIIIVNFEKSIDLP